MACLVKLFEPSSGSTHVDLTASSVELVAVDETTLVNCCAVLNNGSLASGGYGADLSFAKASIVYQVAICDLHGVYGGTTVASLSGEIDGDIDVVLHKLPTVPISGAAIAASFTRTAQRVRSDPFWSQSEKEAVLGSMQLVASLSGASAPIVARFARIYVSFLGDLGVSTANF